LSYTRAARTILRGRRATQQTSKAGGTGLLR
jgi:hypothetical protein